MKRQYSKFLAALLVVVMVFMIVPFAPVAQAANINVTVNWNTEYQTMEGVGGAYAFNKSFALQQISEFDPDVVAHLLDLIFDDVNGTGHDIVRTIMGDGGIRPSGTASAPGFNPLTGVLADTSKPGYDIKGNKIPTLGTIGQYGYNIDGNRYYNGTTDTVWPNEPEHAAGTPVPVTGFAWDLPEWNQPIAGDTGGITNKYVGKGKVDIKDSARTMKELFDMDQVWIMEQAKAYGVGTFYSCAWTPPYWMKSSMSIYGNDGSATTDVLRNDVVNGRKIYFQAYADYLVGYVKGYWEQFGVPVTHVGPYNESESGHGYSGFRSRNAAEVTELVLDYLWPTMQAAFNPTDGTYKDIVSPSGEKIYWVPEIVVGDATNLSAAIGNSYTGPILTNANSTYTVDGKTKGKFTFSTHFYGTVNTNTSANTATGSPGATPLASGSSYPASLRNYSIWQTEFMNQSGTSGSDQFTQTYAFQTIPDAIRYAYMITNCFNSDPGFNAYIWWTTFGNNGADGSDLFRFHTNGAPQGNGATLTGTYRMFKRFYTFGHFSRFTNPGDIRISATTSLTTNLLNDTAYKSADGEDFSITFTNANTTAHTVTVSLQNFDNYKGDLTGVTVFRTSDSENMKKVGIIPVSGGSFQITIPAKSVVTVVPSDGTYATYNGLDGERDIFSSLEAGDNDGEIGAPAGTASKTLKNGDALVFKNINFADGSANGGISRRHLLYLTATVSAATTGGLLKAYVAEPGTVITDPAKQASFVGEFIIPKSTSSASIRSSRIDTGDLGAYMFKDLYLVASGLNGADLFTVSTFKFGANDTTTGAVIPDAVGVLQNGDFENRTASSTANWSASGGGSMSATTVQNYSGLSMNFNVSSNSTLAYSALLANRPANSGIQQNLFGRITAGERYTFRGMFMPTTDGATAKAELIYMNGSTEIGRETIAERSGLDLLPSREGGVHPRTDVYTGIPLSPSSFQPIQFRPSAWYEVTGTFTYNPPAGTTAVWLKLSDDKASDLYIDEVTLVSAPDRAALIGALNAYGAVADSALVAEVLAAITNSGLTQATVNSLIDRLTPSITLGASTIVSGLSAWISVSTSIAEGTVYLEVGGEPLYSADVVDGVARLFIEKAPAPGTYRVVVSGAAEISSKVTVVPYNKDIWKPVISVNGDGKAVIVFADVIAPATAGYSAKLGGEAVAVVQDGNTLVTEVDYTDLKAGDKFVVSGVMYPVLFPSYSFTLTAAVK